jgi:hypothetical protein
LWSWRRGLADDWFVELLEPATNLIARMGRQTGKFQGGDVAVVLKTKDNRVAIDAGSGIQRKGKWNLLRLFEGHHGTQGKPMLGKVPHHATVGGREFHVDEAQGAFAVLVSALGLDGHGGVFRWNSNSRGGIWVRVLWESAQKRTGWPERVSG